MGKQQASSQAANRKQTLPTFLIRRISEGGFIIVLTIALFVLLSLVTYDTSDPNWLQTSKGKEDISNAGGQVGACIADALYYVFGYFSFLIPLVFVYLAWLISKDHRALRGINKPAMLLRGSGFVFMMLGGCALLSLDSQIALNAKHSAGGVLGGFIAEGFNYSLGLQGASLLLAAIFLVGTTLLTGLSWIYVVELIGCYSSLAASWLFRTTLASSRIIRARFKGFRHKKSIFPNETVERKNATTKKEKEDNIPQIISTGQASAKPQVMSTPAPQVTSIPSLAPVPQVVPATQGIPSLGTPLPVQTILSPGLSGAATEKLKESPRVAKSPAQVSGNLPSLSLLDKGIQGKPMGGYSSQELENVSREVEQHLLDFGIQADVVAVHPGPVITRFELQLAAGIKVSKLSALAKDLARSLSVISVRVVEVIPGKTVVGLELPNQQRNMVRLSEVLSADVYQQAHSPLTLALGVDIAGHPMVVDLAKMPHLLVAGTTGSGKSVGINAMILSILFKSKPEEVRLIMVDPKMLELSIYDGIPHLLTPVVTDMKEAASALRWCVGEMERRYRLMAALGVRNLAGFNSKLAEANERGEPITDPLWKPGSSMEEEAPVLQSLPYIVVIIDELADMMMVVGKKVEQLIARIAQKARAAGIHLILATQRPSVDVLTGLIKSNIPTRISFQVSSKIDSRTILDQQGAEQLLGHGDMLYLAPGSGAPLRVHGAFVDDKEVHRITDDWRARGEPEYIDDITSLSEGSEGGFGEESQNTEEADPLYDQAVEFVIQTRKASISAVQRRFKIGYNRAARLVEEMERTGIVGPLDGGFRDVLVNTITED
ncbi:DNA translocase FtsK [Legionella jordanis]|uniref:DNA translocase FtsK n=1 Tax=Legionella jordanis TaxID=456 RepID=A0A0W0V8M3_9GAMM|nr:DNA translocase FtsK [Legionella jordanis]KTD16478.1 cell division protein FtsK [Legionella jordanis]RMX03973.1 DNA translocase FtsK [Legionella jordanis]RMX21957.1 DNA translocase FtsK [Legionella jordanis]VEH12062.1 cell division protein FtsK [Legionella jordanis]HAT8712637.1 cell division protein FtsK [Legionella jordanis]